MPVLAYALLL